jgi:glycosyltransferase involved in cell wall biosynthesis
VVPVRDEERDLGPSIRRLVTYLRTRFPFTARVTIADNGSTDRTWVIATGLAQALGEVRAVQLAQPGRGQALRTQWSASDADVLAYMDVDLSTDLRCSRWSPRCCPGTATWPSAPGWPGTPGSSAGRGAR